MKIAEGLAMVEAILFAHGEPISIDKLSAATGIDTADAAKLIDQLERRYNVSDSGLTILRINNGFQISTRAEYAPYIKRALETRKQSPLSQAALEALAVIAYNQPVTKAFIEQVRGIDSNYVVSTLLERGLIEDAGRLELPGRPIAYRTTDVFLRSFGLHALSDLPALPDKDGQLSFDSLEEIRYTESSAYEEEQEINASIPDADGADDELLEPEVDILSSDLPILDEEAAEDTE